MEKYASLIKHPDQISVTFSVEYPVIMSIGEKMNDINEEAYMNGYNWEAFLNFYLAINHPDLAINMETDSEAGMFAAYYELADENIERAEKLVFIINDLLANPDELYKVVKEHGDDIEWD